MKPPWKQAARSAAPNRHRLRIGEELMETPASIHAEELIHPVYLPFTTSQLRKHFAPVVSRSAEELERYIQYFVRSAMRYRNFCAQFPSRDGALLGVLKAPCQTEKDERFWAASCWLSFFYESQRTALLSALMMRCFGERPPIEGCESWGQCFNGDLHLYFEAQLPSPLSYKRWLAANIKQRNVVPYVLAAALRKRDSLEGPTHSDVLLLNATNGFALVIEAKVISDISYCISFDVLRNQLARSIDVSLDANPTLPFPLSKRRPDRTLVILQTPEVFRQEPQSRLYGWLMNTYRSSPGSLIRDLPHRSGVDFGAVAGRLGWLTWEDCHSVWPHSCRWLNA
jgi:hypothetical protein